ncbi:MAG: type II secretion system protein [Planctomycetes bacterium]|nr:type II secretion system protein [Planctomycetota bacterium]
MSLLEVVIALAVLAIAMTGIIGAILNHMTMQDLDRQLQIASDAAMSKIDEARARDFGTLPTQYPAGYTFPVLGLTNPVGTVRLDASVPDIVTMFVEITWQSQRGQRRFETSTIIGK